MKNTKRIVALLLAVLMLFGVSACNSSKNDSPLGELAESDKSDKVIQIGDYYITEREFYYIASYMKDYWVYAVQSDYYSKYGAVPSAEEIMKMPHPSKKDLLFSDYIKEFAIEVAQQLLVIEKLCDESGLKITNADDINAIKKYMSELEYAYGGEDLFAIKLEELGISKSGIVRMDQMYYLSDLLLEYRYGDNGVARIPEETVNKHFVENYIKYDGASYYYFSSAKDVSELFEFDDEEILEYFKANYVRVNHILYKTIDSNNKPLSDKDKADKKAKAEAALNAINSDGDDKKILADFKSENEDGNFQYVFTYGKMVKPFEDAAFGEWAEGEVKLVETVYGYHLVEKVEMTDDEIKEAVFGKDDENKGMKDEVIVEMANAEIKKIGLDEGEKLVKGEMKEYLEESEDKPYYEIRKADFISKNDTKYTDLLEMVKDSKNGEYVVKAFDDGVYVVRKLDFTEKDITADLYNKIESEFINDVYWEYVQSFYDTMDINHELINKIDFVKLPALEDEFYNAAKS